MRALALDVRLAGPSRWPVYLAPPRPRVLPSRAGTQVHGKRTRAAPTTVEKPNADMRLLQALKLGRAEVPTEAAETSPLIPGSLERDQARSDRTEDPSNGDADARTPPDDAEAESATRDHDHERDLDMERDPTPTGDPSPRRPSITAFSGRRRQRVAHAAATGYAVPSLRVGDSVAALESGDTKRALRTAHRLLDAMAWEEGGGGRGLWNALTEGVGEGLEAGEGWADGMSEWKMDGAATAFVDEHESDRGVGDVHGPGGLGVDEDKGDLSAETGLGDSTTPGDKPTSNGTSSVTDLPPSAHAYEELYTAFLTHPYGSAPSRSLLARQLRTGVPFTPAAAVLVLRHMGPHGAFRSTPLPSVMPLLPSSYTGELFALVLRQMIRETNAAPTEVRDLIVAGLAAQGEPSTDDTWDWQLWSPLVASYAPSGDFRGGLRELGKFRALVVRAKHEAVQNGKAWPDDRCGAVGRVYTAAVRLWTASRFTGPRNRTSRIASRVPGKLAEDLAGLLAPVHREVWADGAGGNGAGTARVAASAAPDYTLLPTAFLQAWLNAERVAGNIDAAAHIWSHLSGVTLTDTLLGVPPKRHVDVESYLALFKLLKLLPPPSSFRPLLNSLPALPAIAEGLLSLITAQKAPDLPLVLALLPFAPDSRTVDLAGTAVIRAARAGVVLPRPWPKFPPIDDGRITISVQEWRWLNNVMAMADLRQRHAEDPDAADIRDTDSAPGSRAFHAAHASGRTTLVSTNTIPHLPLARPMAELAETVVSRRETTTRTSFGFTPETSPERWMVETHRVVSTGTTGDRALAAIPALSAALRAAIVADARRRGVRGTDDVILARWMRYAVATLPPRWREMLEGEYGGEVGA